MPTIDVPRDVYERIVYLAKIIHTDAAGVLRRILELPEQKSPTVESDTLPADGHLNVYMKYDGETVEGRFDPQTERLWVDRALDEDATENPFKSPSRAAAAVIKTLKKSKTWPSVNGFVTWKLVESGAPIDSIRRSTRRRLS